MYVLVKVGYDPQNVPFVPISGYLGENLIEKSNYLPWFVGWSNDSRKGNTLLEAIDAMELAKLPVDRALRIPLQDVYKTGINTISLN